MDVISHGLWGGIAFGRRKRGYFLWAFLVGIGPDIISFGMFSFMRIMGLVSGPDWSNGPPPMSAIPEYVHTLYDITHSLIVVAAVFTIIYLIRRSIFLPLWAWPLHILIDIPTHSKKFFATPFLWPVSDYRFDGIGWSNPYIFWPNIIALATLYIIYFIYIRWFRNA